MEITITVNGNTVTCDDSIAPSIIAALCGTPAEAPKKRSAKAPKKPTAKPNPAPAPLTPATARGFQWYDVFESSVTTITLKKDSVQVKVQYGHADEWHDKLRAAGFSWSRKGFWWAPLDSKKRQKTAERNIANDAATAGMTKDERRAYWQARNAARKSA